MRKQKRRLRKEIKDCLVVGGCGFIFCGVLALMMLGLNVNEKSLIMPGMNDYRNEPMIIETRAKEPEVKKIEPIILDESKQELTIEEKIEEACERYDIPYELPLAIARLETGWFKSSAYLEGNNPGGMSINEVPIIYDTIDDGVNAFVSNLAENYFALGLDTPEEIGSKYCPVNPEWGNTVRQLMNEHSEEK